MEKKAIKNLPALLGVMLILILLSWAVEGCQALNDYFDHRKIVRSFEGENKEKFESSLVSYKGFVDKMNKLYRNELKLDYQNTSGNFGPTAYSYQFKDRIDASVWVYVHHPFIGTDELDDKIRSVSVVGSPQFLATDEGVKLVRDVLLSLGREIKIEDIENLSKKFVEEAGGATCTDVTIPFGEQSFRKSCHPSWRGASIYYGVDIDILTDEKLLDLAEDYYILMKRK